MIRIPPTGLVVCALLLPRFVAAQALTGALIGTVTDGTGSAIVGASVRVSSPAVIGGSETTRTNARG